MVICKIKYYEIVLKLCQCFISHVTTFETEIKLFQPSKKSWNYFKLISTTLNMLDNIHKLQ